MTNPPPDIPVLDDDAVTKQRLAEVLIHRDESLGATKTGVSRAALLNTIKALRVDIDFLLSLVKSHEADTTRDFDWALRELADGWIQNNEREGQYGFYQNARRVLNAISEDAATSMRSACLGAVKLLWSTDKSNDYNGAINDAVGALESVSIQEQKSFPCGAPRPDDGSECLYGVCPRPRDGCSMYCWQHHRSQCVVQQQEAKQS